MNPILQPWHLIVIFLASWINRQQQEVIEYLRTENQVLNKKLGKKGILLNYDQRRRLAVKGKILGRKLLDEIGILFTPDTILRWLKKLIAAKWDYSQRRKSRVGRPASIVSSSYVSSASLLSSMTLWMGRCCAKTELDARFGHLELTSRAISAQISASN